MKYDRALAAANTAEYERLRAKAFGPQRSDRGSDAVRAAVDDARRSLGAKPAWWRRLLGLAGRPALASYDAALQDVARGHASLREIESAGTSAASGELRRRLDVVSEQLGSIRSLLETERAGVSRFSSYFRRLFGRDARGRLDDLSTQLDRWGVGTGPGVLGAELTYVQGHLTSGTLSDKSIVAAYMASGTVGTALEDTTLDREVELSPDVQAKAAALGSATAAYDFVKNGTRLDWYYGSLKGSTETLREGAGNDADLAALLIALLRAQSIPARFVQGTIELPIGKVADLMGLLSADQIAALYAPGGPAFTLPAATQNLVLATLNAAAIPFQPVSSGGGVAAIRMSHVWVEAYLPYSDYRGAGTSQVGRQWIPIEQSIPGAAKYVATEPVLDALQAMNTTPDALAAEYLAGGFSGSALEFYRAKVNAWLSANRPDLTYSQLLRSVQQRSEALPYLPATLPYKVVSVQGEYAFLPDSLKHRLHLSAKDANGTFLDVTLPMHQLIGHRTVFSYKPATAQDAEVIAESGGLYAAPATAVDLLAMLHVDGVEKAVATRPIGLGVTHEWTVELLLPDGSKRRIDNEAIAGNAIAIGLGGPRNRFAEPSTAPASDTDGPAFHLLYGWAAAYVNAWSDGEDEVARLVHVLAVRPTANIVFVENQLHVDSALGIREKVEFKGVQVDADFRTMSPSELTTGRGPVLLRLSGLEGSFQEASVLQTATGEQSISAVGALQEANRRSASILQIDPSNAPTLLPQLSATPDVIADVTSQLNLGRTVLIPQAPLTVANWTGTGYIARDPTTDEGGYFLSGIVSGGQTVISPASWTDPDLVNKLSSPTAPAATSDTSQVARIVKVPIADMQQSIVGKPLPHLVAVYVTTLSGVPVSGASVTFSALGGSSPQFTVGSNPPTTNAVTVTTRFDGLAWVGVTPDTVIAHMDMEYQPPGAPSFELVGLNKIQATTTNGAMNITLDQPFLEAGLPDVPAKMVVEPYVDAQHTNVSPTFSAWGGMETGTELPVTVEDQYGNYVANVPVVWTQAPAGGAFVTAANPGGTVRVLGDPSAVPVLTQLTGELGDVKAGYIPPYVDAATVVKLTATVTPTGAPAVTAQYSVEADPAGNGQVQYSMPPTADLYDGIYDPTGLKELFPKPLTGQLLVSSGAGSAASWQPLDATSSQYATAEVHLELRDDAGILLKDPPQVWLPSDPAKGFFSMWLPYLEPNGYEHVRFLPHVVRSGSTQNATDQQEFHFKTYSRPVKVTRYRKLPGDVEVKAIGLGAASVGDEAIGFEVVNPAGYDIKGIVHQVPNVSGQALVQLPQAGDPNVDPTDPTKLVFHAELTTRLFLPLLPNTAGGLVWLELEGATGADIVGASIGSDGSAPGPSDGVSTGVAGQPDPSLTVRVLPTGANIAVEGGSLKATVVIAVHNFAAAPTSKATDTAVDDPPFTIPAHLLFAPSKSGRVTVTSGGVAVAAANVAVDSQGTILGLTAVTDPNPPPMPRLIGALNVLDAVVPPGDPAGQPVNITLQPSDGTASQNTSMSLNTEVRERSSLPVGHTFVKDVSVVDGHLFKQFEDLKVPSRAMPLEITRSYSNRSSDLSSLGTGWEHNYDSYVMEEDTTDHIRYFIFGGDGGGQMFTCDSLGAKCRNQAGYHGTIRRVALPNGAGQELVFRSKAGFDYHYGPLDGSVSPGRYPLSYITDPAGASASPNPRRISFQYGGPVDGNEVKRVYSSGYRRFLEFSYTRPAGYPHVQLDTVELYQNPGSAPVTDATTSQPLGVCLNFIYDALGNLAEADRYDVGCAQIKSYPPARSEKYGYLTSDIPALQNNLVSYTDPNGNTTTYEYYSSAQTIPGQDPFAVLGDQQERVRVVHEPGNNRTFDTTFSYSFAATPTALFGSVISTFETDVSDPRPNVPATVYRMNTYGAAAQVVRPLDVGSFATSSTQWDPVHVRPVQEQDARGRVTTFSYDDFGNLVEKRIQTPVLTQGADTPTQPLTDGNGNPVSVVVERWSYDPAFGALTCHQDPEGRITTSKVDSDGSDPRTGVPAGTGVVLSTTRHATTISADQPAAGTPCTSLAAGLAPSPADIITAQAFCGVNVASCPPTAVAGDLLQTKITSADGDQNVTDLASYDDWGNVTSIVTHPSGTSSITTSRHYDGRGRLDEERDTFGHDRLLGYDALDRVKSVTRVNRATKAAPGVTDPGSLVQTFVYFPDGQVQRETNGIAGFSRDTTLDARNHPLTVTEQGGGLLAPQTTTYDYDEAGNRIAVHDPRGVVTRTQYDYANRPIALSVAVEDPATLAAQNGDGSPVGQQSPVANTIATYSYDAAGNKLTETDLHGAVTRFDLDPLYRVVITTGPPVPGVDGTGSVQYQTIRRFDRAGNKTWERDGNGHVTTYVYDFADRLVRTSRWLGTDQQLGAEEQVERKSYDHAGNLIEQILEQPAGTTRVDRKLGYDGLNRPLSVSETVADVAPIAYQQSTVYDDANHVISSTDRRGVVTTRHLDDVDRVFEQVIDDGSGLIPPPSLGSGLTPLSLTTWFAYDGNGNRVRTVDALGRVTLDTYDGLNRLTLRQLPMGVSESFAYDTAGHLISRVDRDGFRRDTTYDLAGRAKDEFLYETISNTGLRLQTFERTFSDVPDTSGLIHVKEQDARGVRNGDATWRFSDAMGREVATRDPLGNTASASFDAKLKRSAADRKGYRTTFDYDELDRLTLQADYDLGAGSPRYTQTTSYADPRRQVVNTDRDGIATTHTFDGLGRETATQRAHLGLSQDEARVYDGDGNVVLATDANGHQTNSVFDGGNRRVSQTQAFGLPEASTSTYQYDPAGNLTAEKDARVTGKTWDVVTAYDDLNRPVLVTDALGNVTTRAFDGRGNKLCEKRPLGNATAPSYAGQAVAAWQSLVCAGGYLTTYAYDEESKLLSVTDARGGLWSFVYDETRNLVAKQDGNGDLTTYENDALNRRTAEHQHLDAHTRLTASSRDSVPLAETPVDPVAGTGTLDWQTGYDANGNVNAKVDPKAQRTALTYGLLDRLAVEAYSNFAPPRTFPSIDEIDYGYLGDGELADGWEHKTTASGAVVQHTHRDYDGLDRLKTDTREDGGTSKAVAYSYDTKGNRLSVTDPDSVATSYTYDGLDRIATATAPGARVTTFHYWPDSLDQGEDLPNGLAERRCYDDAKRLTAIVTAKGAIADDCTTSAAVVSRWDYAYDANGNRSRQTEQRTDPSTQQLQAAETTSYGYDQDDWLTGVQYPDKAVLYRLDPVGNRTGERSGTAGASLGPDGYAQATSLTGDVTASFNRADWLLQRVDAVDATKSVSFGYDLDGNQVSKQGTGLSRQFQWDIRNTLTAVLDGGQLVGSYDYDRELQRVHRDTASEHVQYVLDDHFVLEETSGGAGVRRYHYAKKPLAETEIGTATTRLYTDDALGSASDLVGTGGQLSSASEFDAWGNYRKGAPASGQPKLGYTGHQFDVETGLTYARARYYDSETGTFLSRDPIDAGPLKAPALDVYVYAKNNPLLFTDPTGAKGQIQKYVWTPPKPKKPIQKYPEGVQKPSWKEKLLNVLTFGTFGIGEQVGSNETQLASATGAEGASRTATSVAAIGLTAGDVTGTRQIVEGLTGTETISLKKLSPGEAFHRTVAGATTAAVVIGAAGLAPQGEEDIPELLRRPQEESSAGALVLPEAANEPAMARPQAKSLGAGAARDFAPVVDDDAWAGHEARAYSTAFEARLAPSSYPGVSRARHFQEANEQLLKTMESSPEFAAQMRDLGITLQRTATGLAPRAPPSAWTWHHEVESGVLRLVPRAQHTPGSSFWDVLHPEGRGGYAIWGQ